MAGFFEIVYNIRISKLIVVNKKYFIYVFNLIKALFKKPQNTYTPILFIIYKLTGKNPIVRYVPMLKMRMILDLNSHFDKSIFFSGLLGKHVENNIFTFLSKNLKKNSVFLEVGPNSGYFSLLASAIIKAGTIHAFEPAPQPYENMKKSIKLNNVRNIKLSNVCIGDKNGVVEFYSSFHSDVSGLKKTPYQKGNRIIKSKMTTLDNYCKENKIKKIDIVKIDTEGAEKNIVFGSSNIIKKFHPKMIIEFCNKTAKPYGYHPNDIYDFLTKLGYIAYKWDGESLKIQPEKNYYEDEDLFFIYRN